MTLISIREHNGPSATVSFDGAGEHHVTVSPPFSDAEEGQLEWYFEQHLRFPFTEQVRARGGRQRGRVRRAAIPADLPR